MAGVVALAGNATTLDAGKSFWTYKRIEERDLGDALALLDRLLADVDRTVAP